MASYLSKVYIYLPNVVNVYLLFLFVPFSINFRYLFFVSIPFNLYFIHRKFVQIAFNKTTFITWYLFKKGNKWFHSISFCPIIYQCPLCIVNLNDFNLDLIQSKFVEIAFNKAIVITSFLSEKDYKNISFDCVCSHSFLVLFLYCSVQSF